VVVANHRAIGLLNSEHMEQASRGMNLKVSRLMRSTAIQDARQRTIFDFNKGVINKALDRINTKLPADVIGRDAIKFASDTVSDEYDNVLSKIILSIIKFGK
jgi:hypothetical protein